MKYTQVLYDQVVKLYVLHTPVYIQNLIVEICNLLFNTWAIYKITKHYLLYKFINLYKKSIHKKINCFNLIKHFCYNSILLWTVPYKYGILDNAAPDHIWCTTYMLLYNNIFVLTNFLLFVNKIISIISDVQ